MMPLADTVKFTKMFWLRLIGGQRLGLIKMIIDRFQDKHENYKGEKFADYSTGYAEAKGSGDKKRLGIEGQPQASKSTTPDMTLTGKLFRGLLPQTADDNGGTFGWTGPNAAKVASLYGRKNYQIIGLDGSKVLSDDEEKFVNDEVDKFIDKNIKSWQKEKVIITLGK